MYIKRIFVCVKISFYTIVLILVSLLLDKNAKAYVYAASSENKAIHTMGFFTYYIENDKVTICGCDPEVSEAVIPNTIEGLPVTSISLFAFEDCQKMTSVSLPDTLKNLGERAFWNCSKLNEINIPPTLTDLSRDAFVGCLWWNEQLKAGDYVIVNGVLLAASNTSNGKRIIPEGVKKIGDYAFNNDTGLTSVQLPEGLTHIGEGAFMFCPNLNQITFPSTLTTVGNQAFTDTPWLLLQQKKSPFVQINGILIDGTTLSGDVTIPDTITSIADGALQSIELTSVTIPDSVNALGKGVFSGCRKLCSVKLPDSLTFIPAYCFSGCTMLTSINLPEKVNAIHEGAFQSCESLTEICLPQNLKCIGVSAFSRCNCLTKIILPESLENINSSFTWCTGLTEITIPQNVRWMNSTFLGCTSLRSIHISASVTDMEQALCGCDALETISVDQDNTAYKAVDNVLFSEDGSCLIRYPRTKSDTMYTVPDTVRMIENDAFQNAENLKKLTLPEGIESLEGTFNGCHALESITLPKSLLRIGKNTFCCNHLKEILFNGSVLNWSRITIEDNNPSLYQATIYYAEEDTAVHDNFILYTATPSSIIPAENTFYQIKISSENATFVVIAGNAADVSKTGLVKPTKNYGETIIRITDGDTVSFLHVTTEDYAPIYADKKIKEFLTENITDDMTDLEKLEVIGKLPASMDYNADHWDYIEMLAYNSGNCAGSATMLAEMCRRLGIKAWVRNANRDPGAGSAHVNALAEIDGVYYELEAGYDAKAPRPYNITKRTSLYKYQEAADGIDIYQYDGINDAKTSLEIPDRIDGKTVTRIGDGFLTENPWVKIVTIPDTVTEISESAFPDYKGILFGGKGSVAEKFAAEHDIAFRVTGNLKKGDVNADLDVNILDVIALNKYILGVSALNPSQAATADVDADGTITETDSLLILKFVIEIIENFS